MQSLCFILLSRVIISAVFFCFARSPFSYTIFCPSILHLLLSVEREKKALNSYLFISFRQNWMQKHYTKSKAGQQIWSNGICANEIKRSSERGWERVMEKLRVPANRNIYKIVKWFLNGKVCSLSRWKWIHFEWVKDRHKHTHTDTHKENENEREQKLERLMLKMLPYNSCIYFQVDALHLHADRFSTSEFLHWLEFFEEIATGFSSLFLVLVCFCFPIRWCKWENEVKREIGMKRARERER